MKRTASYLPLGVLVLHILLASAKSLTGGAYEISLESSEGLKEVEKSLNKTLGLLSKQGLRIPYSSRWSELGSEVHHRPPHKCEARAATMLRLTSINNFWSYRRRSDDSQPPLSTTPWPHLPLPEVLPPAGTIVEIPCGMFDTVQVELKFSSKMGQPYGRAPHPPPPLSPLGWCWCDCLLSIGHLVMILVLKFRLKS